MKIYHLVIAEIAEADLRGIAEYIAIERLEPLIALNLLAKIGEAIFDLEKLPYRYALVRDERLASKGIRMLPVDNYLVFYIVSEQYDSVTVIRIQYGKREWSRLL